MSKEELRPCPFCGIPFESYGGESDLDFKCDCILSSELGAVWIRPETSKNAYCWKENNALKAKLDEQEMGYLAHVNKMASKMQDLKTKVEEKDEIRRLAGIVSDAWQKEALDARQLRKDIQTQLTGAQTRYQAAVNLYSDELYEKAVNIKDWEEAKSIALSRIEKVYQRLKGEHGK